MNKEEIWKRHCITNNNKYLSAESLKLKKIMIDFCKCLPQDLALSDGKVKNPSYGVSGIKCGYKDKVYLINYYDYQIFLLDSIYDYSNEEVQVISYGSEIEELRKELKLLQIKEIEEYNKSVSYWNKIII